MKVLICGGRDLTDQESVNEYLDWFESEEGEIDIVIHGAAKGADTLAHNWAVSRKKTIWPVPAAWNHFGVAAGYIRNKLMLELKPGAVIAFPGGKGTQNMIKISEDSGVKIYTLEEE